MSMCLMVDSNRLSEELSNFESYYLDELDFIDVDYYPALNEILDYIQSKIKLCKNDEHSELLINVLREVKHSIEEIYDNNNYIVDEN